MNLIKKSILVVLLVATSISAFAQKKSMAEKRAEQATNYVAEKMSFNDGQKAFLNEVYLEKFGSVIKQTQGKELSKEERKPIYQAANKAAMTKLKEQFTMAQIKEINKYQQEANKQAKKK